MIRWLIIDNNDLVIMVWIILRYQSIQAFGHDMTLIVRRHNDRYKWIVVRFRPFFGKNQTAPQPGKQNQIKNNEKKWKKQRAICLYNFNDNILAFKVENTKFSVF